VWEVGQILSIKSFLLFKFLCIAFQIPWGVFITRARDVAGNPYSRKVLSYSPVRSRKRLLLLGQRGCLLLHQDLWSARKEAKWKGFGKLRITIFILGKISILSYSKTFISLLLLQFFATKIKIGPSYQASIPPPLTDPNTDERGRGMIDESGLVFPDLEKRAWVPSTVVATEKNGERNGHESVKSGCFNRLTDSEIDKFLIIARSVGTLARSLECSSSLKQPSLHMSAAAASR